MSVIEVRTFRLAAGCEEGAFLAADREMQALVHLQRGIVRRTTARHTDGFAVLTTWADGAHADAAALVLASDPAGIAFRTCVDAGSVSAARFETLD